MAITTITTTAIISPLIARATSAFIGYIQGSLLEATCPLGAS